MRIIDRFDPENRPAYRKMLLCLIALIPAYIIGIYIFAGGAAMLTLICVAACVIFERIFTAIQKRENTIEDFSAVITGAILSFLMPPEIPIWVALLGSFMAIFFMKMIFGGFGNNIVNPAVGAVAILTVSFPAIMNSYTFPDLMSQGTTQAALTPLQMWMQDPEAVLPTNMELFLGFTCGTLGGVSVLALLIGGIFLVAKRVISPVTPLAMIATVALVALIVPGQDPLFHVLAGNVVLGAIFLAGDPVTTPAKWHGKLIFGVGAGLLVMGMRLMGSTSDGVIFAILIMNLLTPVIERIGGGSDE